MNRNAVVYLVLAGALLAWALGGSAGTVYALTGGPGMAGYVFTDSDEPDGPTYSLEDITSSGTALTLSDDQISGAINIGFAFKFFGVEYTQLYIGSNGFITFLAGQITQPTAQPVPTAASPNGLIAGWWGDLKPNRSGSIAYQLLGSAPERRFVIQYQDIAYSLLHDPLGLAKVSFEIKLYESSQAIEVHYASVPPDSDLDGNLFSNTAGIENETGARGLPYYYGTDGLPSSLAVRYTPFEGVSLEPNSLIGYGEAGETEVYQLSVYNWTPQADTFDLSITPIHNNWTPRLPADTGLLEQGQRFDFTLEVDFPADAVAADYSSLGLHVTSRQLKEDLTPWTDVTPVITAVPRVGFVFNQNQLNPVDTQFHQDLGMAIETTVYGPFLLSGALSPDGGLLYGLLAGGQDSETGEIIPGKVLIFDTDDPAAEPASVEVGLDSSSISPTPDGKYALITGYGEGLVQVVDTDPSSPTYRTLVRVIPVGSSPIRIATSPCFNKAYVTNKDGNSVTMIDLNTLHAPTPRTVTVTGFNAPWDIVIAPSGDRAYVTSNGNGSISVIDTVHDILLATWDVGGSSLQDADVTPDGSRLYVTGDTSVLGVNTTTGTVAATIANAAAGLYGVEVFSESMGPYAYSANGLEQTISVLDTGTNEIIYTIPFDGAPSMTALFPPETTCPFAPIAAFEPTNAIAQLDVPFAFTDRSIRNPTSYSWDFGDGSDPSSEANPSHTYTVPGTYTVTLTTTNDYGSSQATGTVNFKPKAGFTPVETAINLGDPVSFTNASTGNPTLSYSWAFGDGATSTDEHPTHTYSAPGTYTVTLRVTNLYGEDTATGTVAFLPKADFSPLDSVIQTGTPLAFTNLSTGSAPLTYTWDFGDGTSTSSEASPAHTYLTAAPYTVSLTVENPWGTSTKTGTVNFRPKAGFTPPVSLIQPGETASFTNTSTGNEPMTYRWDFGDDSTSTEKDPTHTYTEIDRYTVTLEVENAFGTDTFTGTVAFPPRAAFTQSDSVIQTGDTVSFVNGSTGTEPLTYLWEFGDGATSTERNPTHTYTTAGAYVVRLTVTSEFGSSQATGAVNFAPRAAFTPTENIIQLGQALTFSNQSTGTADLEYEWDFGDGSSSTTANPTHTYAEVDEDGEYTVTLRVRNDYGNDMTTGIVVFKPKAAFTPANSVIQLGDPITFQNESSGSPPLSYHWDFGDGATSSEQSPTHTYTAAGSYTVSLKVDGPHGTDTVTGTVNFKPMANFSPRNSVIQLGESLAFTNASSGTAPLTYEWRFGDGTTSTQANPTHTYTAAGSYTVILTVTNTYGNHTQTGTVNFRPRADFLIDPADVVSPGTRVTFANRSTGTGALTFTWDFGDGSPVTNQSNPSHSYPEIGTFVVKLTAHSDTYGEDTIKKEIRVAIFVLLTVTMDDGADRVEAGEALTYTVDLVNEGTVDIFAATAYDEFPEELAEISWTCSASGGASCPSSGSGPVLDEALSIPAGGSLTYTIHATVKPQSGGPLSNTFEIILPGMYQNTSLTGNRITHVTQVIGHLYLPAVVR